MAFLCRAVTHTTISLVLMKNEYGNKWFARMIVEILRHHQENRILLLQAKHKQLNYIYANKVACAKNVSLQVTEAGNSAGTGRPSLKGHASFRLGGVSKVRWSSCDRLLLICGSQKPSKIKISNKPFLVTLNYLYSNSRNKLWWGSNS